VQTDSSAKVKLTKLAQLINALVSIVVTEAGIIIEVNAEHLLHISDPILVQRDPSAKVKLVKL